VRLVGLLLLETVVQVPVHVHVGHVDVDGGALTREDLGTSRPAGVGVLQVPLLVKLLPCGR
jgi:hypothetical protein